MSKYNKIIIPPGIIKYILFQRTHYLVLPNRKLFIKIINKLSRESWFNIVITLESIFRKGAIRKLYTEDMLKEYNEIKDFLPVKCLRILDIGCGIGGINFFIFKHYNQNIEFHLLDKSIIDQNIHFGFRDNASFYNSLKLAKQFLNLNSIPKKNIYTHEATPDYSISINGTVDLIISLLSWGFHYPVAIYLERVSELLSQEFFNIHLKKMIG